eukprot:11031_4
MSSQSLKNLKSLLSVGTLIGTVYPFQTLLEITCYSPVVRRTPTFGCGSWSLLTHILLFNPLQHRRALVIYRVCPVQRGHFFS